MKVLFLGVLVSLLCSCGFEVVDTGYRGVKIRFGEVIGESLPEGLYFYNSFTTGIKKMDVREEKITGNTDCYTQDMQMVKVEYAINLYPDATKMHVFYKNLGNDWREKIIPPVVDGRMKEVVGKYHAVKMVEERAKAISDIKKIVTEDLSSKNVIVKDFVISNLDFHDNFETAVEAKVVAIQNAERAKNETVQIQEQAKQKVIAAEAEAKSMTIRAQALSQNKNLVEYEAVQKWDGKLPEYVLGNSVPFISLGKKGD